MARVLIGWELGAGTGHHVKIATLARALRARGHGVVVAAQDPAAAPDHRDAWQAPIWPGQLTVRARPVSGPPATMGDILVRLGLAEAGAMRAMLAAWDNILAAVRPDVVIAEYAPALMLAARGRLPLLALGTGFSLPPANIARFPLFEDAPPPADEQQILAALNRELAAAGRPALAALPGIFAADLALPCCFEELDPYRSARAATSYAAPSIGSRIPATAGDGDELFVYLQGSGGWVDRLWTGLAASGLKVRLYHPLLTDSDTETLERAGLTVERKPVPIARIAERSRMVLSHGGLGFASSALIAGLPHIILFYDVEKRLIGKGIARAGLGMAQRAEAITVDGIAELVRGAHADAALHARTRAAAPDFRRRMTPTVEQVAIEWIEARA